MVIVKEVNTGSLLGSVMRTDTVTVPALPARKVPPLLKVVFAVPLSNVQ